MASRLASPLLSWPAKASSTARVRSADSSRDNPERSATARGSSLRPMTVPLHRHYLTVSGLQDVAATRGPAHWPWRPRGLARPGPLSDHDGMSALAPNPPRSTHD